MTENQPPNAALGPDLGANGSSPHPRELLELYLLDELDPAAAQRVRAWLESDPQGRAELAAARRSLQSLQTAVRGPAGLTDRILAGLGEESKVESHKSQVGLETAGGKSVAGAIGPGSSRRRFWQPAGMALAAAVVLLGVLLAIRWGWFQSPPPGGGHQPVIALDPGDRVNTDPDGQFQVLAPRRIRLESGQVRVAVHHAAEPFIVETPAGDITVLGTQFTVKTYPEGDTALNPMRFVTTVAVLSGVVQLTNPLGTQVVQAGGEGSARTDAAPMLVKAPPTPAPGLAPGIAAPGLTPPPSPVPGSSGPGAAAVAASPGTFQVAPLGPPLNGRPYLWWGSHLVSGCRVACLEKTNGKVRISVDGQPGPEFDLIVNSATRNAPLFSSDSRRVAYIAARGDKQLVVADGKPEGEFDWIVQDSLCFSPDGKRLAYVGRKSGQWAVVADGQPVGEYDRIADPPVTFDRRVQNPLLFSPDGRRLAFAAKKAQKWQVIVDGQPGPAFDAILAGSLAFSADGKRVGYLAIKGDKQVAVVDGQSGAEYDTPGLAPTPLNWMVGSIRIIFSPDGKRVAYAASKNGHWLVDADGVPGAEFEQVNADSLAFSADSKHLAYVAVQNGQHLVVTDGQAGKAYLWAGHLVFSPVGARPAYVGQGEGKSFLVVDGKEGPALDGMALNPPLFSPDGQRLAVVVGKDQGAHAVVDGQAGKAYNWVGDLQFSPDGKHVSYVVNTKANKKFVVMDGQEGAEYDNYGGGRVVFSPDSKHWAFLIGDAKGLFVVLDGKPGPQFHQIGRVMFSPDGQHLAYDAHADHAAVVAVDGQMGPEHESIVAGPIFRTDGVLEYLAVNREGDQTTVSRVTRTWGK